MKGNTEGEMKYECLISELSGALLMDDGGREGGREGGKKGDRLMENKGGR